MAVSHASWTYRPAVHVPEHYGPSSQWRNMVHQLSSDFIVDLSYTALHFSWLETRDSFLLYDLHNSSFDISSIHRSLLFAWRRGLYQSCTEGSGIHSGRIGELLCILYKPQPWSCETFFSDRYIRVCYFSIALRSSDIPADRSCRFRQPEAGIHPWLVAFISHDYSVYQLHQQEQLPGK